MAVRAGTRSPTAPDAAAPSASFHGILLHPQGATLITVISGRMRPEGNGYLGEDKSIKWFRRRDEQ